MATALSLLNDRADFVDSNDGVKYVDFTTGIMADVILTKSKAVDPVKTAT
jgi:hypothetical protein